MSPRTSTYWRRLALSIPFAAVATFSGSALGDPAVACAEPREWDIGYYDDCVALALADYQGGKSTFQDYHGNVMLCCQLSGGDWDGANGSCQAPAAEQAQEAERQPATPEGGMTLWPGTPVGPVAPPAGEATLAP